MVLFRLSILNQLKRQTLKPYRFLSKSPAASRLVFEPRKFAPFQAVRIDFTRNIIAKVLMHRSIVFEISLEVVYICDLTTDKLFCRRLMIFISSMLKEWNSFRKEWYKYYWLRTLEDVSNFLFIATRDCFGI